ncbi:MAG TPA: helix-turn-helix transcriptional regulator [Phnomibacter sp.]|nr:helix-turn-helix transcriptional regulator [Phnomibacter sp.]
MHPALQPFVKSIVVDAFESDAPDDGYLGMYPPTPQHVILFYLGHTIKARIGQEGSLDPQGRMVVVGPQIKCVEVTVPRWHRVLVVRFQPGGLFRLLGLPMAEIVDEGVPGADLLGKQADELLDRLRNIPDNRDICRHVEIFLLSKAERLMPALPLDEALNIVWQRQGNISVDEMASLACLSVRQFERRCLERIGMSPKLYTRITRFSNAYRLYEAYPHLSWTDVAHRAGYFDQMHFIRDFKQFTGATPTAFERTLSTTPVRLQADIKI